MGCHNHAASREHARRIDSRRGRGRRSSNACHHGLQLKRLRLRLQLLRLNGGLRMCDGVLMGLGFGALRCSADLHGSHCLGLRLGLQLLHSFLSHLDHLSSRDRLLHVEGPRVMQQK